MSQPFRLVSIGVVAALVVAAPSAWAHCDTLSGPVVKAAQAALESGNLQPLLKWVKPPAEAEVRAAFRRTQAVRAQGGESRDLADRFFLETVVRLHRAGEGAPYAGLKTEADDPGGLIAASDTSLETGSAESLTKRLTDRVAAGLRERHARVVEAAKHAEHNVEAGRQYVEAYVEYLHYVEALQQLLAKGGHAADAGHRHER